MVDGIAAVVNDTLITHSEVEEAARGSRFFAGLAAPAAEPAAGEPPAPLTRPELQASQQHLIDQALLERFAPPVEDAQAEAEFARQLEALRARAGGETAWQRHLRAAGLSEPALERLLRHQLTLVASLDQSFRAQIHVDDAAVAHYYTATYLPALPAGATPPPLPEVRDRIAAILTEQRLDELQQQRLRDLRLTARIEIHQP